MRIRFKLSIILVVISLLSNQIEALANVKSPTKEGSYQQVFEYIKKKQWQNAETLANNIGDRALIKIVLSQEFLDDNYSENSFEKITNFLKKNPHWPQSGSLKTKAENLIDGSTNKLQIYEWFKRHKPSTGNGHKYYAQVAEEFIDEPNKLAHIVKNAWIYGCFGKEEQAAFYKRFKQYLSSDDTVKRIDNMLWKGSTTAAKASLGKVKRGYQQSFEAQIALINGDKNAKQLFQKVSKEYYTPGLIYRYISSRKNDLSSGGEILKLIKLVKNDEEHSGDFWKIQSYLAREYIENRQFNNAYLMASNHFTKSPANASDAEFLSGWIALRFLNKPKLAIEHFQKFNDIVKTSMSTSRGLYWLGRAYESSGNKAKGKALYEQAAHQFGYTFYGQVATMELGLKKLKLPPRVTLTNHSENVKNKDLLRATELVTKYGSNCLIKVYLDNIFNSAETEQEVLAIALAIKSPNLHHKVWLSRTAMQKHVFLDHYSYPTPYKIDHLPTEKALTYSIIRQESSFEHSVIAPDKGMGLMQLMEPTACSVAKKLAVKCNLKNLTADPYYNLTIGTHYLSDMLKTHQNYYVLAIAAYNAGPHRVKKWLNLYGDLRSFKDHRKAIDWIESIPFSGTRNYVQRVLENLQVYRAVINKDSKFKLKQDLLGNA